jgi:hypothetical protein
MISIGTASSPDPVVVRICRIFGDVDIIEDDNVPKVASERTATMPRPKTESRKADTVGFWMPDTVGAKIEGNLTEPTKEEGFRGNVYHLAGDDGVKTRLPVHAELCRKLDGIALDIRSGKADPWVALTYTKKDEDGTRHYDVEFWPAKGSASK